jgi:FKBP-type peptidyl-prolyl cis-trans isomerase SlyD
MAASETVQDGMAVAMHYTLTGETGEVIDNSSSGEPLQYLHGARNIVVGLERQLTGLSVGDKINAVVAPEEGYGVREGPGPQPVPRTNFPPEANLEAGMIFHAEDEHGQAFPVWVTGVEEDEVFIDGEHPLAGVTLNFAVEIVSVRPATDEEKSHGHIHGPGGHDH